VDKELALSVCLATQAVVDKALVLSQHSYGCRVVQRLLEHCTVAAAKEAVLREVLANALLLAQDTFGNYVIQHILERGPETSRCAAGCIGYVWSYLT
jgi:Pumilio-family RNA binding repeat